MPTIRRSLPSLSSLTAFEAAARHGSFTQAAAELGVTQAAVSRQIRLLEEDLSARLFVRSHRRVDLTPDGERLARVAGEAFGRVAEALEAIRRPMPDDTVVVGTTLAFSHFWLVPRLSRFRSAHPGIRLRLISEDAGFDLRQGRMDVVVRYGEPPFADAASLASMADEVFPVCSPALLRGGDPADLRRALTLPLIGLEWLDPAWLSWARWAAMVGAGDVPTRSDLRFNHYTDAVYAAINGDGVLLGWRRMIAGMLADGRLIRLGMAVAVPPERYHLLRPDNPAPTAATACFTDWLMREFGSDA